MTSSHALHQTLIRNRRIGRRVLQADRLSMVLSTASQKKARTLWRVPHISRKVLIAACVALVCIGIVGGIGMQRYSAQVAAAQKAAAAKQLAELKAKSASADACRREKAEQKADLIGKITFDELYDYGACDK